MSRRGAILLFHGPPGSGKSTLCKAALRQLLMLLPADFVEHLEFDELYVNFARETEFDAETWKLARKSAFDKLKGIVTRHCSEDTKLYMLVDDTFHLPSMRKIFCRIAQANNLMFHQFAVLADLEICIERSSVCGRHLFATKKNGPLRPYPHVPESVVRSHLHLIENCRGSRSRWFDCGSDESKVKKVDPGNLKFYGAILEKWERNNGVASWVVDGHDIPDAVAHAIVEIVTCVEELNVESRVESPGSADAATIADPVQEFEIQLRRKISEILKFLDSPDEKRKVAALSRQVKAAAVQDFRERLGYEGFSSELIQDCLEKFTTGLKADISHQ